MSNSALWAAWQDYGQVAKECNIERINQIFAQIKQAACKELKRSAARFARLGKSDESVYTGLASLMRIYSLALELVNNIKLEEPTVKALLDGICEVLASRLKEFEDAGVKVSKHNPIGKEKGAIFDYNAKELSLRISSEKENTDYIPAIYAHFTNCLRNCLAELDHLPARKTTSLYIDLIQREWEELGNIIKVQVLALENATAELADPANTSELTALHHILNMLRSAYQHTGPVVAELQKLLSSTPALWEGLSYEDFAALMPIVEVAEPEQNHEFFALLDSQLVANSNQLKNDLPATESKMQCAIDTDKQLAKRIIQEFSTLRTTLPTPTQDEETDPTQIAILGGITETVDIKIESMQDSIVTFEEDGAGLLQSFAGESPAPTEKDIATAQEIVRTAWLNSPPENESDISEFFAQVQEAAFANFNTRMSKYIATSIEKMQKLTLRFKKEVLLYEVCTYEEILTHSVSRLRDSANEDIANAAKTLDNAYIALEALLEKHNITHIRPAAHEPFNAFEHDVLVAEKTEGFNKGEIVKIINTGYRQGETVILRANVIAAR